MKRIVRCIRILSLLLVVASSFQLAKAQTTVQIGFGSDVPPNTLYFPVYRYTNSSTTSGCRSNVVFTQPELATAGITTGSSITAVAFNKVNQAHFLIPAQYKLYMANTSNTSLSTSDTWAGILSTHTEVYNNPSFDVQDAPGWFTINVTPFVYTGGSLEIACDMSMTGGATGATDKFQWEFSADVDADKLVGVSSSTGTVLSGSVANYKHRPNIKITFVQPSPCTTPPTPGTATSTAVNVCSGETFTLGLSGNSTGSGQSYQWQSSPDNVNWTDIPGAIYAATQQTQSATTYYHALVTCSGNTQTSTSVQVLSPSLVQGTFTINNTLATGGSNFASFGDAVNYIKCGISGPVEFNVAPGSGPYMEQIVLPEIFGTSSTNTITFNGNGATLSFTADNTSDRAGIMLDGTDHVTIDSLMIDCSAGTYGWGIHLTNAADSNTIKKCTITASTTSTSSANHATVVISGSNTSTTSTGNNGNYNTIMNNTLVGGYYNVVIYGQTTDPCTGNMVMNNVMKDSYSYANYIYGQDGVTVAHNNITRPTRSSSGTTSGAYVSNASGVNFYSNRVHNMFGGYSGTGTCYAIYFNNADGTTAHPNKVYNNLIYDIVSSGTLYGIYNSGSDSTMYYHNTIVLDDVTATGGVTKGFYQTTTATGVDFRNNIVVVTRGGTAVKNCIDMNTTASEIISNNNVLYINSPLGNNYTGSFGTDDYATLSDWQTANSSAFDAASIAIDPLFMNFTPEAYIPSEASINNIGEPLGILTDIYGVTRTPLPDPGAVEFTLDACTNPPTPGLAITSDAAPCGGADFSLNLDGNSFGAGQTYQWQWSTDDATWSNVGAVQTTSLFSTSQTSSHYYRAELKCSGGAAAYSLSVFVEKPDVAGSYTINNLLPTGGTNFASFGEAVAFLKCGVTAPVVFTAEPFTGPYMETVTIGEIPGTSSTNTISFMCNGVTLSHTATASADRAALILDGADHIIIDSLVVDVTSGASYGWGMVLTNQADSNIIRKCTVTTSTSSSSSNFSGIILNGSATGTSSSGNNANYNLFENNLITGGYYGFYVYGSSSDQNIGNMFVNNKIRDHYYYGMYVYGQRQATISKTDISRPARTAALTSYGMYFTSCTDSMVVEKNRVHNMFDAIASASSTCYSIYITTSDGIASYPNKLENNLVHSQNSNSTLYGIYCSGDYWNIYHNTVILDDVAATTSSPTYAFYANAVGVNVKNNIAFVSRGGTGTKACLNLGTSHTGEVNRNDWFMASTDGTNNYVGYQGSGYSTLDDWKLANGSVYDQNSASVDPLFQQLTIGNYYPSNPNVNNLGEDLGVLTDILGEPRGATPDPGAYEFSVASCINPPTPGVVSAEPTVCPNTSFALDLQGNSAGEGLTYQWQVSTDDANWIDIDTPMLISSINVEQAVSSYYRALVKCNAGAAVPSASVFVTSPGLAPAGTYTINSTVPTGSGNFQSFGDAVNFIACGIAGPIVFNVAPFTGPYNEQVTVPAIGGTSASNTITWNGNGNTISYDVNDGGKRGVFTLDGADHMIIDSLNIDASLGTYGFGYNLTNSADSNIIRSCSVLSNTSSTSTNYGGIIMSGSTGSATTQGNSGNGNLIMNNMITGGYYGVHIYGSTSDTIEYNSVINNTIKDFYSYAVYTSYSRHTTFSGNDISRPTRSNSGSYALYVGTSYGDILVEKNKVHNVRDGAGSGTAYPYYLTGDGTATWPNRFENNIAYNIKNGSSTCYGLYAIGANYWTVAHNTIVLDDASATGGTTYGMYIYGTNTYLYNNIVSITRGGTGTKYCLYMSSTGVTASNNNVLYMGSTDGSTNGIGYDGGGKTTLAEWQTLGYDLNSSDVNPMFTDALSGNLTPLQTSVYTLGNGLTDVTTDILGTTRRANDPTPGAFEMGSALPVTILGIDAIRVGADVKVNWATVTEINNKGFDIERSLDGTSFRSVGYLSSKANNGNSNVKLNYEYLDLLAPASDVYYRLKQLDNNGRTQASNVVRVKALSGRKFDIVSLFPNPARKVDLNLQMSSLETSKITLVVTDVAGKILLQQNETLVQGTNNLKVNVRNLPAGNYFIRAVCSNGCETTVRKFVVQ